MVIGIILASGFSRRMGKDKLLMEIDGVKMIESVIKKAKDSSLDEIILIYRKERVGNIGREYNIKTLYNPRAGLGQSEGLKLAVKNASDWAAYMFLVGDQPFITSLLIDSLINEYKRDEESIIVPYYDGKRGMPTIFPSSFREELLKIKGDKGGRDIIDKNPFSIRKVYIDNEELGFDIDSLEDLKKYKGE